MDPTRPRFDTDGLRDLIQRRRTTMLVDRSREVPHHVIAELCELAQWAPNHKRTWPWRFAVFTGDARGRLGETLAEQLAAAGVGSEKVEKARGKYLRTPAVLAIGTATGDSAERTAENRDAVAAGVQNLLLGATARGLASYWGSCPEVAQNAVRELCGFEHGTHITALIYLGWANGSVEAPARPSLNLVIVDFKRTDPQSN